GCAVLIDQRALHGAVRAVPGGRLGGLRRRLADVDRDALPDVDEHGEARLVDDIVDGKAALLLKGVEGVKRCGAEVPAGAFGGIDLEAAVLEDGGALLDCASGDSFGQTQFHDTLPGAVSPPYRA